MPGFTILRCGPSVLALDAAAVARIKRNTDSGSMLRTLVEAQHVLGEVDVAAAPAAAGLAVDAAMFAEVLRFAEDPESYVLPRHVHPGKATHVFDYFGLTLQDCRSGAQLKAELKSAEAELKSAEAELKKHKELVSTLAFFEHIARDFHSVQRMAGQCDEAAVHRFLSGPAVTLFARRFGAEEARIIVDSIRADPFPWMKVDLDKFDL